MRQSGWSVVAGVTAAFVAGFVGGCAPTGEHEAEALTLTESALTICGNGSCDSGETCAGCPGDCGRCTQAHCGDGTCGRKESCATCAADCGSCPGCGNGVCDTGETCSSCSADCGRCSGEFCGNGVCGRRESCTACVRDCCPGGGTGGGAGGGTGGGAGGGTGGGAGGGAGGGGGGVACMLATDCPMPMGECQVRTCVAGVCSTAPVAMGTPTSMQTAGDCQTAVCDGMGGVTAVNDDTDIADDGNECTYDTCSAGTPSSVFAPAGDLCTGGLCDGAGTCVGCLSDAECPAPMNECQVAVCDLGVCGTDPVLAGTPTSMQTQGDCHLNACSGGGTILSFIDDTDVPSDGNMCTVDACVMGMPVFGPQPYGTPCMENGGAICDGMGTCIPPP